METPLRIVQEADVIRLENHRIYALSRSSGLSIIDATDTEKLKLEGHFAMRGEPFEMYIRGDRVMVMTQRWVEETCIDFDECGSTREARLEVLDASSKGAIQLEGSHQIPGDIDDSRLVGEVLYVVSHLDRQCEGCSLERTTISSFRVPAGGAVEAADKEIFNDESEPADRHKSVAFFGNYLLVAGSEADHSSIRLIDGSSPDGQMTLGTTLQAKGWINSRWQMDMQGDVLRVISQPSHVGDPPWVETFRIDSASATKKLATLAFEMPAPERLRSVRFDGERAFAITAPEVAIQKDPLFTFDLSDPGSPKQMGSLEMPGWVYHMEPRGDRLLALGYEQNDGGLLNVTLFDVSKLDSPKLLERVHFGPIAGADYVEGQNQIHKAFHVLDEQALLAVPFGGRFFDAGGCEFKSGIQLIDFDGSSLKKRGVAPETGKVRRALVKDGRLLTLADDKVRSFDISDRDAPEEKSSVGVAKQVFGVVPAGDQIAQLTASWWTNRPSLELAPSGDPAMAGSLEVLDLALNWKPTCEGSPFPFDLRYAVRGERLYLFWNGEAGTRLLIASILGGKLAIESDTSFPFSFRDAASEVGQKVLAAPELAHAMAGDWLVLRQQEAAGDKRIFHFIDVSDAKNPANALQLELPSGQLESPIFALENALYTSHSEGLPEFPSEAAFFLDRIDLSDPKKPVVEAPVPIEGLLARVSASGRLWMVALREETIQVGPWQDCSAISSPFGLWGLKRHWLYDEVCLWTRREMIRGQAGGEVEPFSLSLEDKENQPARLLFGEDTLFLMKRPMAPKTSTGVSLVAVGDLEGDAPLVGEVPIPGGTGAAGFSLVSVDEGSAILSRVEPLPEALVVRPSAGGLSLSRHPLEGPARGLRVQGGRLLASLGERGLKAISLP